VFVGGDDGDGAGVEKVKIEEVEEYIKNGRHPMLVSFGLPGVRPAWRRFRGCRRQ